MVLCAVAGTMFSTEISTYAEEAIHFIEAKLSPASESDVEIFADAALVIRVFQQIMLSVQIPAGKCWTTRIHSVWQLIQ